MMSAPDAPAGGLYRGRDRWMALAFHGALLALLALHLYVRTLPATQTPIPESGSAEALWWGLWPITYLPAWSVIAGTLLVLLAIAFAWLAPASLDTSGGRRALPATIVLMSLALVWAFTAFPIVHTRWGDAYMLARGIAWPDPALRLTHSWQAPLDVWLHSQIWLRFHARLGWGEDATVVYRLLSPVAGIVYLSVIGLFCLRVERFRIPIWFGLFVSLGTLQLFFGYVENYSLAAAGIVAYLWSGLELCRGRGRLWQAATLLALTMALHPSTLVLGPSLIYLAWLQCRPAQAFSALQRNKLVRRCVIQIGVPMIVIGALTVGLMEAGDHGLQALLTSDRPGGGDGRWFVPLWQTETRWERYLMFSRLHLRDWLNEWTLIAPILLPAGLILWIQSLVQQKSTPGRGRRRPESDFLLLAASCYALFTWLWNPDYGGQRDWDLFSLAALPAAAWLAQLWPARFSSSQVAWRVLMPGIVYQGLHTAAWIYQNTLPWEWP